MKKELTTTESINACYSFMYEVTGTTSTSALESSLKRLVTTYGVGIDYKDHKVSSYNKFARGCENRVWDIMITRGCINLLMSCGMDLKAAIASIQTIMYMGVSSSAQGRHQGVKGERKGEGRKSRGTNQKFIIKSEGKVYEREWKQISYTNRTGALLDFCAEFYANYRKSHVLWSRQKLITLMSRMKKRYDRTPSMEKIFGK